MGPILYHDGFHEKGSWQLGGFQKEGRKEFHILYISNHYFGVFPGGSDCKESAYNAGDLGLIPGSGRSSGEGNSSPLHYSWLENPMDRGS